MNPLVSIIMPCYNAEKYIAQSIDSVLAQTYQNWELLITDDFSTDTSIEIINSYCKKDSRIKLLVAEGHQGVAKTRYYAVKQADGHFLAFLDSDDLWHPEKLQRQIGFMLNNGYGFTYTDYELISDDGTPRNKIIKTAGIIDYRKYLRNTIIGCSTVIIDRQIVGEISTPHFEANDDMALWCMVFRNGFRAYPLPLNMMKYRQKAHSASSDKLKAAREVWAVYRKQENLSFLYSCFNFCGYAFNAVKKRLF